MTYGKFNDYIRVNGQVQPISVVQLSPEEGGIVQEKVVEEGAHVKKGDVILRLSNSNLDLQILNAESELAEKQNLLRNTQVTMQQDKLNNETEKYSSISIHAASSVLIFNTNVYTKNVLSAGKNIFKQRKTMK